ncbi:L,D-transpeptidase family protein [Agriterribacter sp.]|uniref:L,D-transpeptidase family protein n=1 Tax=Agriterribacter sp. TaxID=2821509 RepID=UPI002BF82EE9|nr:L,D-transpeptidase family protein [Agriterribacter sp.]HRO47899.1 L,D-transpeptidase family protein [Agriterribacter sp.]HRQ15928.1 L,D-transpeptidase family protein [Agriterribacter sp.]
MKQFIILMMVLCFVFLSCRSRQNETPVVEERDTTITVSNAYTQLFFDSIALEHYIQQQPFSDSIANRFRSFYNARNYQYAWFFNDGPAEQAYNFLNLQSDYISYSRDSSLYNPILQQVFDTLKAGGHFVPLSDTNRLKAELSLTSQFFRYAEKAYQGDSNLNSNDLKWYIPRKKINEVALLDSLIAHKGEKVASYEPVNIYYQRLKQKLLDYYAIEKKREWQPLVTSRKKLELGDTAAVIAAVKQRLLLLQDMSSADTSWLFTDSLKMAVEKFQLRHGMQADGIIGAATLRKMNESPQAAIRKMLINMERMRWVPSEINSDYLLVNIPDFKLHVFENGSLSFSMNVVVGTTQHNTVVFSGDLKYVVFSPYWNVPASIVKNEIMPGMEKNKNYIARHNMEITGYSGTIPIVRQKPGPNNSLGKVKFLFPNSYNIYLHDTPQKSLFGETRRAFSHGCIRLNEPRKLAEFLLRNDSAWTASKITAAMNSGKEKYVTLKEPVKVFIGYFTAWVDSKGALNFRDDIYGHDARIAKKMFEKGA